MGGGQNFLVQMTGHGVMARGRPVVTMLISFRSWPFSLENSYMRTWFEARGSLTSQSPKGASLLCGLQLKNFCCRISKIVLSFFQWKSCASWTGRLNTVTSCEGHQDRDEASAAALYSRS